MVNSNANQTTIDAPTPLTPEAHFEKQLGQLTNWFRVMRQTGLSFDNLQRPINDPAFRVKLVCDWKKPAALRYESIKLWVESVPPTLTPVPFHLYEYDVDAHWLGKIDAALDREAVSMGQVIDRLCHNPLARGLRFFLGTTEKNLPWSLKQQLSVIPLTGGEKEKDLEAISVQVQHEFLIAIAEIVMKF